MQTVEGHKSGTIRAAPESVTPPFGISCLSFDPAHRPESDCYRKVSPSLSATHIPDLVARETDSNLNVLCINLSLPRTLTCMDGLNWASAQLGLVEVSLFPLPKLSFRALD